MYRQLLYILYVSLAFCKKATLFYELKYVNTMCLYVFILK